MSLPDQRLGKNFVCGISIGQQLALVSFLDCLTQLVKPVLWY